MEKEVESGLLPMKSLIKNIERVNLTLKGQRGNSDPKQRGKFDPHIRVIFTLHN